VAERSEATRGLTARRLYPIGREASDWWRRRESGYVSVLIGLKLLEIVKRLKRQTV